MNHDEQIFCREILNRIIIELNKNNEKCSNAMLDNIGAKAGKQILDIKENNIDILRLARILSEYFEGN